MVQISDYNCGMIVRLLTHILNNRVVTSEIRRQIYVELKYLHKSWKRKETQ